MIQIKLSPIDGILMGIIQTTIIITLPQAPGIFCSFYKDISIM